MDVVVNAGICGCVIVTRNGMCDFDKYGRRKDTVLCCGAVRDNQFGGSMSLYH